MYSRALQLLDQCLDSLGELSIWRSAPAALNASAAGSLKSMSCEECFGCLLLCVSTVCCCAIAAGAAANIDIFAAAAALAADKALAADALAVEFVPQVLFLQEGMELLQQAKDEMQQISSAVLDAQVCCGLVSACPVRVC